MHFSCKISNAILNVLEKQGVDLALLYEQTHLPVELLRDPSYWMSAPDMEHFLDVANRMYSRGDGSLILTAGMEGPNIRPWGVLDSVLRMMPQPQEIFNQPEQFLSYFIAPKPPIENLKRDEHSVAFDLPLPAEQYPLVTSYLKAAFESLPIYVGQPSAVCEWSGIRIQLNWATQQSSIFQENVGHQISPALFQSLIQDLQKTQREREDLQKYVGDLEERIRTIEKQKSIGDSKQSSESVTLTASLFDREVTHSQNLYSSESPEYVLRQNLARMHDYMVRAQQLITMLVAQGKMSPATKEAMRRIDWEHVKIQYPQTVLECMELVKKMNNKNIDKEGTGHV